MDLISKYTDEMNELMDKALNNLTPQEFEEYLKVVKEIIKDCD